MSKGLSVFSESPLCFFVFKIEQYILNSAVKNGAKIIKGYGAYGFVVLQTVNKTSADTVTVNELIC